MILPNNPTPAQAIELARGALMACGLIQQTNSGRAQAVKLSDEAGHAVAKAYNDLGAIRLPINLDDVSNMLFAALSEASNRNPSGYSFERVDADVLSSFVAEWFAKHGGDQ